MGKTYKRVPFDIELAKKIQSGEVEGRIVTIEGYRCKLIEQFIELPEETPKHEFKVGDKVKVIFGMYSGRYGTINKIVYHKLANNAKVDISATMQPYLPCEYLEKYEELSNDREYKFKPFDKVLVRNCKEDEWQCNLFSHLNNNGSFRTMGGDWIYCIPYEGNEHLVGTTKNPE